MPPAALEVHQPPVAARESTTRTHHGHTIRDPYHWLSNPKDPRTLAYLEAENAYTEAATAHLGDLRETLFTEIKDRTEETDLSVPVRKGRWWYYSRTHEGRQYPVHCRLPVASPDDETPPQPGGDPETRENGARAGEREQVLLDENELAAGSDFFAVGVFDVSPDGDLLAYATDHTGDERFTLRVLDLRSGQLLPDEVPNVHYGTAWSRDGSTVFYTTADAAWRAHRVWRHRLGTAAADDDLVLEEADERFSLGVWLSRSERFVVLAAESKVTSEVRVLDAADPDGVPRVVAPRRTGVEYGVEHVVLPSGDERFLVLHNDGAPNFELAEAPVDDPSADSWVPVVGHRDDTRLLGVEAFASHLVVHQRREALTGLRVIPLRGAGYDEPAAVRFDEPLYTVSPGANPRFNARSYRLTYTSFVTPPTVYDYDVTARRLAMRKQQPVLGGYQPGDYEQRREWATTPDGTRVPVSLVHRRSSFRRPAPCLLYGYGSYEMSLDPWFSVPRLSLLDRGFVFAVAHVRGGGELGRSWYEDGKLTNKQNTFTDFVACARHLLAGAWTTSDRLVGRGASAGGLLMGAVANQAPGLFAGIVAEVPFVDALTSMLDPSLPLTVTEWDEWGDPLHNPEHYGYLRDYSPYENVTGQQYPPILALTGLNDTRVRYSEPAKWVARLRATATGQAPVLLKTELGAGHGGRSGRYDAWREQAFINAWILDVAGAAPAVTGS